MSEVIERSRFEEIWHCSETLAVLLVVSSMALALWAAVNPQSPGVCIGILAALAGLISVRPEMHFFERIGWIAVLVAFVVLEVRSIKANDEENRTKRDEQNVQFSKTAEGLKEQYQLSQTEFGQTRSRVNKVF